MFTRMTQVFLGVIQLSTDIIQSFSECTDSCLVFSYLTLQLGCFSDQFHYVLFNALLSLAMHKQTQYQSVSVISNVNE